MGAADSKEEEAEIVSVFTPTERQQVRSVFETIVANQKWLTAPFLQKYYPKWLGEDIQHILFHVICNCEVNKNRSHDNRNISEIQFAGFLAQLLKGTYTEKANIMYLLCRGRDGIVSVCKLYQIITNIVRCYVIVSKKDSTNKTWKSEIREEHIQRFSRSLLGLKEEQITEGDGGTKPNDEIERWLSKQPLFLHMFDRVFNELFPVNNRDSFTKSFMPNVANVNWTKTSTILDILSINYINFHLPRVQQSEWRLLYSNILHGESFAQLVRFICDKGPNVIVVKEKDGHCFGAYVADSWDIKPQFYGTSDCFLFTLSPCYGVYTATGYNQNFMYLNQGQATLPNGLGLGGQLEYFGLWIDYTFNTGHSKAKPKCTTYGSPQLSAQPEFEVDTIEVWAVGPEKKQAVDSDEEEYNKRSILDKDAGAKAILEMAGKKQHSEGLRDLAEDEGPLSDEMKKKMNTIPKLL